MGAPNNNRGSGQAISAADFISPFMNFDKAFRVRIGAGGVAVGASETATTLLLPAQAVVYDAFLNVLAASTGTTKTLLAGLLSTSSGGVNNGFLNAISVSTTGLSRGQATVSTSGPGSGGLFYSSATLGSFLLKFQAGSTAAGDPGIAQPLAFNSDSVTAKTVSFTPGSSDWAGAFKADLYIFWTNLNG